LYLDVGLAYDRAVPAHAKNAHILLDADELKSLVPVQCGFDAKTEPLQYVTPALLAPTISG
jgi:hypothetical protein